VGLGRSDEDVCKIVENKDGKYEESKISEYRKKRFKGMYDDKINPSIISFMGWDIGIEEIEGLVRDISLKEGVVVECRVYSSRFDGYDVKGKKKSEYGRKLNKIRSKMALDGRNIGDIRGIIRREVLKLKEITIEEISEGKSCTTLGSAIRPCNSYSKNKSSSLFMVLERSTRTCF